MRRLFLTLLIFMIPITSQAITYIHTIEGISEYRLQNGLQILLIPDASKQSTTVNMTYRVGSRHEAYGQTGIAHLLEHLVFRGTPSFPNAIEQFAQKGLHANGTTSADRTNYFASFSEDPSILKWYLEWQADTMQHLGISEKDLKAELGVVLNERDQSMNNPMQVLLSRVRSSAYHWNNAGLDVIGAPDNLLNITPEKVSAFYHNYYQPDNASLIIAGKFDKEATLSLIDTIFSPIVKPSRILTENHTHEPIQDGERNIVLRKQGGVPIVVSAYHIPTSLSPEYMPIKIAINILSDHPSGVLYRRLVQDDKIASNTFSTILVQNNANLAVFGAQLSDENQVTASQEALSTLVENTAKEPFTKTELNRVRTYFLNQWHKLYADTHSLSIALSESIAAGDWRLFFWQRDKIKEVTLAQMQKVAEKYFISSNRTSGQYIPTENPLRAPDITSENVSDILKNYHGNNAVVDIEEFDTSADNIQQKTLRGTLTLPNGNIHYALLPKASRGDRVYINYRIKFSSLDKLNKQAVLSNMAANLIGSGTDSMDQQAIQDKIDALNGSLSFHISANQLVASLSTDKHNAEALLDFSFDLIRKSNYPEKELTIFIHQVRDALTANASEPAAKASLALNQYLNNYSANDFRRPLSTKEQLDTLNTINREKLIRFNRNNFAAGNIDISAVGSFDAQSMLEHIQNSVKNWPSAPPYEYMPDPYGNYPAEVFTIKTPDKANAIFLGKLLLPIQNNDKAYPAIMLANYLLGGSQTSYLFKIVRAEKGLSYGINSSINASSFEPSAEWFIHAIYSPDKKEEIKKAIADTIADLHKNGFTQDELDKGITAILNMRELSRTEDRGLSAIWLRYLESGRDFMWNKTFEDRIRALTLEDVNNALRKYFDFEAMSKAYAGDFSD